jgi:hypothetical protein
MGQISEITHELCGSRKYHNRAAGNLKGARAGKITGNQLFSLAKPEKCCYTEKIPVLSVHLGGGNDIHFRTCETANPDQ